ncbi:MAG: hypothetical protein IV088_04735 [Hydrogenophaga sp.]|uniref:hypothetical protein n=1 Tax=Hydrogenophaga sp. TaxID=1904254 RepID=UPI0025C2DF9D|nr:hypothetical protein [Hydrogenophaga sp.]MBT9550134.1 hypothetical protein [Hydrogenophaga sp.]
MKPALTTWLLLFGLLLQSVAWALPTQRTGPAERLAHELAHAIDHGHHQHPDPNGGLGHDLDATLLMDDTPDGDDHGPHHAHASEGVQCQGLPVASAPPALIPSRCVPRAWTPVQPPSADPEGLLRPPRFPV